MKKVILSLLATVSLSSAQNAVILGHANTQGGHADSSVYVQGSWSGTQYEINSHNVEHFALYVGNGNLTTNFLRAQHGISHISGGVGNFDGTLVHIPLMDFTPYAQIPNAYSALAGNPVDLSAPNNIHITLDKPINVFDINTSQISGYKTVDFNGGGIVVFNVTGNLNDWGWSLNYDPSKVVFNFEDATVVNINNRQFTGSILAPFADVSQQQNVNGFILANNWNVYNSVELHNYGLPKVPEPSSIFLALLGGLFLARRKR